MDNQEMKIRKDNRKALPLFLAVLAVSAVVGGVVGFFAAKYGLNEFAGSIRVVGAFFGRWVAPWLTLALAIALPAVCVPKCRAAQKLLDGWDGEDETVSDAAEKQLSDVVALTGGAMILNFFLIAAAYAGGFEQLKEVSGIVCMAVAIAGMVATMIECVMYQKKTVDMARRMNPEKQGSVYDMKFQQKFLDSCDEAEKIMIGQCALKAYRAVNSACTTLAIVLALGALIFDIGFLPSLVVCAVWMANHCAYVKESMRLSKAGNKVMG